MRTIGIATNKSLLDLINKLRSGELILRPEFQRKLVWNDAHKENFIETILKKLPFPEIYLASGDIDLEKQQSTTLVVDGQQRLNTIYQYVTMDSNLVLSRISPFSNLDEAEKTDFFDYQVVVRDLGRIEESELQEIFKRINSVQYALNAVEIANALYDGEYISTAKEIAESALLRSLEVFSDAESTRMRDIDFVLLTMTTIEVDGYFSQSREVADFIARYDDSYPSRHETSRIIMTALDVISSAGIPPDSLWFRKSSFFTLLIELAKYIRSAGPPETGEFRDRMADLERDILEQRTSEDPDNEYAAYYKYVFQNTSSRLARVTRGKLVESCLKTVAPARRQGQKAK